jgi:dolichol-phosphate mannosyltransferase
MTVAHEEARRVDKPEPGSEHPTAPRPLLSIVVPAYNEAGVVGATLERIAAVAAAEAELAGRIEAIVISDGSTDTTFEEACDGLRYGVGGAVIELTTNVGSHAAIRWALRYARGDFIAIVAADGQDPPEALPAMLRRFRPPIGVVWGRRRTRHDPLSVRLPALAFYRLFRLLTGLDYPRSGIDFFVARRRVIDAFLDRSARNSSVILSLYSLGFGHAFVDYDRGAPIRIAAAAGIVVCLAGVALGGVSLMRAAAKSTAAPGWAAVMVLGSLAGGAMFLALALLGEYVWRVLDEARGSAPLVEARHERVGSAAGHVR